MNQHWLISLVLFLQVLTGHLTTDISGKVLDHTGKPIIKAKVVYTNMTTGTTYHYVTDKKGEFFGIRLRSGDYNIEITGTDGVRVYTGTRSIGFDYALEQPLPGNFLNADLSLPDASGRLVAGENQKEADSVRRKNADNARASRLMEDLRHALDSSDWQRAAGILKELIASDPNRWEFWQNLGSMQNNLSQYQESVQSFEKAIALLRKVTGDTPAPEARENISQLLISQAEAYNRLGKPDEAVARYLQAAEIAPQPARAYLHACNSQSNSGHMQAAIELCNRAVAADPGEWHAWQIKAQAETVMGNHDDALASWDKGIQIARDAVASGRDMERARTVLGQMLNSEGNFQVQLKQFEKAIPLFTEAAEVSANPASPLFNLCATQFNLDHLEAALTACDKTIAANPGMADAYFVKASILFGEGRSEQGRYQTPDGTREALTKYLELDPEGSHANDARDMLRKIGSDSTFKPKG